MKKLVMFLVMLSLSGVSYAGMMDIGSLSVEDIREIKGSLNKEQSNLQVKRQQEACKESHAYVNGALEIDGFGEWTLEQCLWNLKKYEFISKGLQYVSNREGEVDGDSIRGVTFTYKHDSDEHYYVFSCRKYNQDGGGYLAGPIEIDKGQVNF